MSIRPYLWKMGNDAETYILACPKERQKGLHQIREMVLGSIKGLEENMRYGMPTYEHEGEPIFAFASQKHYMSFYVCHYDLMQDLKEILAKYNCGKSCIRFKTVDDQTLKDLKHIIKHTFKNIKKSANYGKHKMK